MSTSERNRTSRRYKSSVFTYSTLAFVPRSLFIVSALLYAATLCASLGCQTAKKVQLPKVVAEDASAVDIIKAINENSSKIQSISSSNAAIGAQAQPGMANCHLFFKRDQKLRVVGTAAIFGRVVDCGCDGAQFWFWSNFTDPNRLFVCKLDQFQSSALANIVPVDPTWFPEAIGVVNIDESNLENSTKENNLVLLTVKATRPDGVYRKRIYVEPQTAAIRRQDIQAPNGVTVVSVICNEHQLVSIDDGRQVVMPKKLEIRCETTGDTLLVNLDNITLNDASKFDESVFQRPEHADLKAKETVDLGKAATAEQANLPATTIDSATTTINTTLVPPPNFQPVRSATPTTPSQSVVQTESPASNDGQPLDPVAFTQPTLPDRPVLSSANGPDLVPFPTTVAHNQPQQPTFDPAAPPSREPVEIQPTQSSNVPYVAISPNAPKRLSLSESPLAQSLLNLQQPQYAQTESFDATVQPQNAFTSSNLVPQQLAANAQTSVSNASNMNALSAPQPTANQASQYAYQAQGTALSTTPNMSLRSNFDETQSQAYPNTAANQTMPNVTSSNNTAPLQAAPSSGNVPINTGFNNYANPVNQTSATQPVIARQQIAPKLSAHDNFDQAPTETTSVEEPLFDSSILDDDFIEVPAQPADPFDATNEFDMLLSQ